MTDDGIAKLLAEQEIRRTLADFCRGVDRGDTELIRSCYHTDAWDDHGAYRGDVDGLIAAVEQLLESTISTQHVLGQAIVDVDLHAERATSESYVIVHHRLPARGAGPERDLVVGARYLDVFELRDASWKIARRMVVHSWSRRVDAEPWLGADAIAQSSRDPDDPLYEFFA